MDTKIIVYIFAALIILLLVYGIVAKRQPQGTEVEKKGITKTQLWILLVIGGIVVAYLIFKYGRRMVPIEQAMTMDEFDEIVKERMVKKHGVKGYYDEKGNLQYAPDTVYYNDQRPFVPTGTSHEFMVREMTVANPDNCVEAGIVTMMVNLNKGKKLIKGGNYAIHMHSPLFHWLKDKSFLKKLPVSSPEHESLQLAQYAAQSEIDVSELERLRRPVYTQRPPELETSEEETEEATPEPVYRRRKKGGAGVR